MREYTEQALIDFQAGTGVDQHGRTLAEVVQMDDRFWEDSHDHIQWVFPTAQKSRFNPAAPVVTDPTVYATPHMAEACARFLSFLRSSPRWKLPGNHNQMRISRALQCLDMFGHAEEAAELRAWLGRETSRWPERIWLQRIYREYWERPAVKVYKSTS